MPDTRTIRAPERTLDAVVDLPRSKSVANRALVLAALAGDTHLVRHLPDADDSRILHAGLTNAPPVLHAGAGGTTFRFLLAWACAQPGREFLVTGDKRLLERPHHDLVNALRASGARVERLLNGFHVRGTAMEGGEVAFDSPVSSQYLSALLLIAPTMRQGLRLRWTGRRLSVPYVRLTLDLLRHFGAQVREEEEWIVVDPGPLRPVPVEVPCDWSAAAFWYQVAALAPRARIALRGLRTGTGQGDERAVLLWAPWVATSLSPEGITLHHKAAAIPAGDGPTFDLRDTPDLFQPLVFTLAGLGIPATFIGLDNLPLKETDRIQAVGDALRLLGVRCHAGHAGTFSIAGRIVQPKPLPMPVHGDHRMAMGLAPLALVTGAMVVRDPQVVAKSYPAFWQHLAAAGFRQQDAG